MISDILYYTGAVKMSFEYSNTGIEKEIRNYENRATNCVAKNIYRAVNASHKQIEAIEALIESHKFDSLPEELRETALIRLNNPESTMIELSLMHSPPISKSGLNHRLKKIVEFAIHINCYNEWETSATYDQPAEGGCEIDVEIDAAIAYDENGNEIEVVCKQSVFEYEFAY